MEEGISKGGAKQKFGHDGRPVEFTLNYKDAGVDIDAADEVIDAIRPAAKATGRPGAMSGLGGFGALFDLKAAGYRDPILVSGTDGVGTKLKVAAAAGRHDTIGIDLVAMCVNDLVVQGAEPLFFLDYFGTGRLEPAVAASVINGIADGCRQAGCALIGGETAELPSMYADGDYDLAGFAVGAVERDALLTGDAVREGDVVLGFASSGLHSNGFSLARRVVELADLTFDDPAPFAPGQSIGEAYLTPTRIYVRAALAGIGAGGVHAISHITGGGLLDNIPRVLPGGLGVDLYARAWDLPPVFAWLAEAGGVAPPEMARTFNCGIGMVALCPPDDAAKIKSALEAAGETISAIGEVVRRGGDADRVRIHDLEDVFGG